jgi:hypothetical protein
VAGSCECGYEPSGSIKCGEFLDSEDLLASEGLCSMELVKSKIVHIGIKPVRRSVRRQGRKNG